MRHIKFISLMVAVTSLFSLSVVGCSQDEEMQSAEYKYAELVNIANQYGVTPMFTKETLEDINVDKSFIKEFQKVCQNMVYMTNQKLEFVEVGERTFKSISPEVTTRANNGSMPERDTKTGNYPYYEMDGQDRIVITVNYEIGVQYEPTNNGGTIAVPVFEISVDGSVEQGPGYEAPFWTAKLDLNLDYSSHSDNHIFVSVSGTLTYYHNGKVFVSRRYSTCFEFYAK